MFPERSEAAVRSRGISLNGKWRQYEIGRLGKMIVGSSRMGIHAFHAVLLRKSHDYGEVIKSLEFELSLPRSRLMKRRFGKVTKESRELFALLSF